MTFRLTSMMALRWSWLLLVIACGCSAPQADPDNIADAIAAYDAGSVALENQNFTEAQSQLRTAIDAGGLNPDLYVSAYLKLAEAEANLKNFAAAHAALDIAEQGAADMRAVYSTRALVFKLEGKPADAARAEREAKTS